MSRDLAYVGMAFAPLVFAFVLSQVAMLATTVYLHRDLAHGGSELRPEVRDHVCDHVYGSA